MAISDPKDARSALVPALAGQYAIDREIGRGGMATVYLARDLKHDRRVAIKVLNPELGAVLGAERFLSEIRVTANLQHPNLLPLFDSGEAAGLLYYVMPFVDGESLRGKLTREKQLSVDEVLRIAVAIANALEYAHEHGVVHRDLKPENILLQSGQPIVADFGIALAVSNAGGARVTQTGLSLGTPQYMSPEQATGDRHIDARSDVYALGAMTYEMLVGEPPHTGSTAQAIIARLITDRPRSVRESRPSVPEHVDATVARALEKLPADRLATAAEFAEALQGRVSVVMSGTTRSAERRPASGRAWVVAGVATLVALGTGAAWLRGTNTPPPPPTARFTIELPRGVEVASKMSGQDIDLSPDGRSLAFIGTPGSRLFVRRLDQLQPMILPKAHPTDGVHFSPDGKSLVYNDEGPTTVPVAPELTNAEPQQLAQVSPLTAMGWHAPDILYITRYNELFAVSPRGGAPRKIATMDTTLDADWAAPTLLPDGETITLSVARHGPDSATTRHLGLISIKGGPRTIVDLESYTVLGYLDGILIYMHAPFRLMGVRFDLAKRKPVGEPVVLVDRVEAGGNGATLSNNGTLAYLAGGATQSTMQFVDERGAVVWEDSTPRTYTRTSVSPDGKHIGAMVSDNGKMEIWVCDVATHAFQRIGPGWGPGWSPDGKHLTFVGSADPQVGGPALWVAADGSNGPEPIPGMAAVGSQAAQFELSPDMKYALVPLRSKPPRVVVVPLAGGAPIPMPALDSAFHFSISPNGKWVAYTGFQAKSPEVYVSTFPSGAGKKQISAEGGGIVPHWSHDGSTLYYTSGGVARAATLNLSGAMPNPVRSDFLAFFRDAAGRGAASWSPHPDGKHFVVTRYTSAGTKIVVVTNWMTEVRAKLAGK